MARLHRDVLDALLARIVDGRYPTGAMLPKEEALRDEFDVSRGTAREALRALEERNVATVKHGRGATVQPPQEWNVLDPVVARALAAGRKRRAFLRELAEYRLLLESEAATLAAERATATQRDELRAAAREIADADDAPSAARRLRRLVAVASGNRPLAATLRAVSDAHEPALGKNAVTAYVTLADAIADADPDAARDAVRAIDRAGSG